MKTPAILVLAIALLVTAGDASITRSATTSSDCDRAFTSFIFTLQMRARAFQPYLLDPNVPEADRRYYQGQVDALMYAVDLATSEAASVPTGVKKPRPVYVPPHRNP